MNVEDAMIISNVSDEAGSCEDTRKDDSPKQWLSREVISWDLN